MGGISEVVQGKLYFAVVRGQHDLNAFCFPYPVICFNVDKELLYEPFYADFGPLNLACTYRFCQKNSKLLKEAEVDGRCVCFCCSSNPKEKANAAVLLGSYLVICEGREVESAYEPLAQFGPYLPFRDLAHGKSTYNLSVRDCIRGVAKAIEVGWIDFKSFNVEEYEYYEKLENGDLNWIIPKKIVAFSGPQARHRERTFEDFKTLVYIHFIIVEIQLPSMSFHYSMLSICVSLSIMDLVNPMQRRAYRTLVPADYVEFFIESGVTTVIRLNKRLYDKRDFTDHGLSFYDLYFPDGSCPPEHIVQKFLEIVEGSSGAVAVHCKAGLGRTGVLIGCYIMKHFRFTANEALGYLRIVRPGSVIGFQQQFLRRIQAFMWKAGELPKPKIVAGNTNNTLKPLPNDYTTLVGANMAFLTSTSSLALNKGDSEVCKKYISNPLLRSAKFTALNDQSKTGFCMLKNPKSNNYAVRTRERKNIGNEEEFSNDHKYSGVSTCFSNPRVKKMESSRKSISNHIGGSAIMLRDLHPSITCKAPTRFKGNICPYNPESCRLCNMKHINGQDSSKSSDIGCNPLPKDACTHRTINSAGQPRKLFNSLSGTHNVTQNSASLVRPTSNSEAT